MDHLKYYLTDKLQLGMTLSRHVSWLLALEVLAQNLSGAERHIS